MKTIHISDCCKARAFTPDRGFDDWSWVSFVCSKCSRYCSTEEVPDHDGEERKSAQAKKSRMRQLAAALNRSRGNRK